MTPWGKLTTSLVIVDSRASASFLITALQLDIAGDENPPAPEGIDVYSGPGWATLTIDERYSPSPEVQARALTDLLDASRQGLAALKSSVSSVKFDVSGVADSGNELNVSPITLTRFADFGISLSFTAVRESGEDETDPLAWLDG